MESDFEVIHQESRASVFHQTQLVQLEQNEVLDSEVLVGSFCPGA
jgi:hypothetical protein